MHANIHLCIIASSLYAYIYLKPNIGTSRTSNTILESNKFKNSKLRDIINLRSKHMEEIGRKTKEILGKEVVDERPEYDSDDDGKAEKILKGSDLGYIALKSTASPINAHHHNIFWNKIQVLSTTSNNNVPRLDDGPLFDRINDPDNTYADSHQDKTTCHENVETVINKNELLEEISTLRRKWHQDSITEYEDLREKLKHKNISISEHALANGLIMPLDRDGSACLANLPVPGSKLPLHPLGDSHLQNTKTKKIKSKGTRKKSSKKGGKKKTR